MIDEDVKNVITAIKSENWAYVCRWLPKLKHADQFYLLSMMTPAVLNKVRFMLFNHRSYLERDLYEVTYSSSAAVTILRMKDSYSDVKRDPEGVDKGFDILEELKAQGLAV